MSSSLLFEQSEGTIAWSSGHLHLPPQLHQNYKRATEAGKRDANFLNI